MAFQPAYGDEISETEDKPLVRKVKFLGNRLFSSSELEDVIMTKSSSLIRIPPFRKDREYDPIAFQTDSKRIERFYRRKGYYQAKVRRSEANPCDPENQDRICVEFEIVEGAQTNIGSVDFVIAKANPPVERRQVEEVFALKAGDRFEHDKYLKQKNLLEQALREWHYPLPEMTGEALYDEESNSIRVTLSLKPGTAARIGYIHFEGLDEILQEDAMSRLPIKTGEYYDPRLLDDADALLARLDVFRSISPELKLQKNDPSTVNLIYHVREKPLKTLLFGGGVRVENSRQEARLRAEWTNRNFYSHLRTFNVSAEPRYAVLPSIFRREQSGPLGSANVEMRHPAFLSARQDLRTAVGFDSDLEQAFKWYGPRVNGNLERTISRTLSVAGGYSFRYLTFYSLDVGAPTSSTLLPPELLFNRNYRLGFIDQRLTWDRRDSALETHSGFFTQVRLEESVPMLGSAFTYLRTQPEVRFYLPTTSRATLALRAMAGRMFVFKGSSSPITERFYGGGASHHRAFSYHQLSPQVRANDGRTVPVGGESEVLFTVEERIRLFQLGQQWLLGAIFFDAGDVVASPSDLNLNQLHYGLGGGLRYDTPVGVIRADVGARLNRLGDTSFGRQNPDPGRRFAIHISFGEAF